MSTTRRPRAAAIGATAIALWLLLGFAPAADPDFYAPDLTGPTDPTPAGAVDSGHWAGDLNCDGVVDFLDINPFVLALTDPAAYAQAYPNCDILEADANCDGLVNFDDINPFVNGGYCLECNHQPWWCPGL